MVFNIMKKPGAYIVVGLLFFTAFSETGWAAVENRISPTTIPPSSRREGLIRSPGAIDGGGNLLVTGNIRGPAYFRGVVPYYAPTSFGQTLPSSSLDSFLRDSAGSENFGRYNRYSGYPLGYRPYYSPTQTVASAMPGASAGTWAPTANIGAYSARPYLTGTLPMRRDEMLDTASAMSLARLRPMSMTPAEMQKLISSEIAKDSPARLTGQQYQPEAAEQYKPNISQESYKSGELKKPMPGFDGSLLPSAPRKPGGEVSQPFGTPTQKEQAGEKTAEMPFGVPWAIDVNKQLDVYGQMKQQLDSLQKKLDLALVTPQPEKAAEESKKSPGERFDRPELTAEGQTQEGSQAEKLAEINLSVAKTGGSLGPFETFASFSEDKFNQNMRAAELYLKQGRYYRAADAYTLASLYKPDDPLAYAGKSHALFASGEYMSSALFLSRTLQIFPEYARFKIDIVAMMGGRDKLESRIVDVEEWLKRSGAPELQFLLAYVYYQMDRPAPAKEAIDAACEKMPQSSAVLALKKVIEDSQTADPPPGEVLPAADKDSSQRITDDVEKK
jgi:tetratricopeptide (TPR) repeat protein